MQNGTRLAAVDLGSNSFRLEIGQLDAGHIHRTEYLKETVRIGGGLDDERNLTEPAMQRALDCLARFGERLSGFGPAQVRAVATQTLREAHNRDVFLARAHQALGVPIDVISGREEARLIYQGVARLLPQSDERRLVVDIGGRSTELITGQGFETQAMESFRVGSVAWSMRYFGQGQLTSRAFQMAEVAAKAVLDEALNLFSRGSWELAYGSSGTVGAVEDALAANGWPADVITRAGLDWLRERLIRFQRVDQVRLEGMKDDRRTVIGGGLSILRALFDLLGIEQMTPAQGGLRHGVLYDLLDREQEQTDLRANSVQRLCQRADVDADQRQRLARVVQYLYEPLLISAGLPESERAHGLRKLNWAAQLHEIGCQIAHADYHRHGAYILDNTDAAGFAQHELHRLSLLVLGHRGKLRKLEAALDDIHFVRQLLCLRLAVILCHARRDPDLDGLRLLASADGAPGFSLRWRAGWAEAYPQSAYLLREEVLAWQKTPWTLALDGE